VLAGLRQEHRSQAAAQRAHVEQAALLAEGAARAASGAGGARAGSDTTADAALLRERGALQGHSRAVDDLLQQAAATAEALRGQRSSIAAGAGRLGGFLTALPGASALIGAISARRTRNDLVVNLTVAACACFTVWWLLLRK
jgi:hypothetical protein